MSTRMEQKMEGKKSAWARSLEIGKSIIYIALFTLFLLHL